MKKAAIFVCFLFVLIIPIQAFAVFLPDENGIYNSTVEIEKDENKVKDAIEEGKPISDTEEIEDETTEETDLSISFDKDGYSKYVIKPSLVLASIGIAVFVISLVIEIIEKRKKKTKA